MKTPVAAAAIGQPADTRRYNLYEEVGHIARYCKKDESCESARWALEVLIAGELTGADWIVDSGARAHLVRDSAMPYD